MTFQINWKWIKVQSKRGRMTQIRKFIPVISEYAQTVAIERANFPEEDLSVQSCQWQDQHIQPTTIFSRWVGELDGNMVSHAYFIQDESPGNTHRFKFHMAVHPTWQGRGYGSQLFHYLQHILSQYAPCILETSARQDHHHVLQFLEHRAFKPTQDYALHTLSLSRINQPFELTQSMAKLSLLGFNICTLQDAMQQIPDWKIRLHAMQRGFEKEVSAQPFLPWPQIEKTTQDQGPLQEYDPVSTFLARYHQHWIGLAGLRKSSKQINCGEHGFTGVLRPFRRNGIATNLIKFCVNFALTCGYTNLEADCQKVNALEKIHEQVGYRRQPGRTRYELQLTPAG